MLGAYDVRYMPLIVVNGKILANFVTEFTKCATSEGKEIIGVMTTLASVILPWEMYIDGVVNRKWAGDRYCVGNP